MKLVAVGLFKKLNTTTLLWTATVVRHRCHVSNHINADTESCKSAN